MDLMGSYRTMGYTVEVYFPERHMPDAWAIWVIRDGFTVCESKTFIAVQSVYGMDRTCMAKLEAAAEAAVAIVIGCECTPFDAPPTSSAPGQKVWTYRNALPTDAGMDARC